MADKEWAEKALSDFQREEQETVERLQNINRRMDKALAELKAIEQEQAEAVESLKGIRGCIAEMKWQLDYYKEHGKLP